MRVSRLFALPAAVLIGTGVHAQTLPKIGPDKIGNYWIMLNMSIPVDVPNSARGLDKTGCAAVSFSIGSDGLPRGFKVEKVNPSGVDFGALAQSAVSHFAYGPSLKNAKNKQPVSTYYIVPFNSPKGQVSQQKAMEPCRLPGYDGG